MLFNGANVAENIDVSANGSRVRFFRDIANVTMDLDDVEGVDFNALGGADNVVVGDLSGTDVAEVNANLAAAGGAGDAQPDHVIAHGTNGDDVAIVAGDATGTSVFGLAAQVNLTGAEAANDRLTVRTLAGDDVVDASVLAAAAVKLTLDGGDDDDILLGGEGDDTLLGGEGDDVLLGGGGLDTIDGGPGSNVVIQGLVADQVSSATTAGKEWLETHGRTVGGKTVLELGGKERTLPRADLPQLVKQARAS
jgi:Ca2+-binding RTX toxin-like protein